MTSTGDVKLRAVIQFCQALGKTPTQTFKEVQNAGKYKCCRSLVFRWHKEFREGRESVEDEARSGRPATKRISLVQKVKDRIAMDRRFTVRTLAADMDSSKDTVLRVLHDLNMRKVCARWVPRLLTDVQKAQRVTSSMEFLTRCDEEGDRFLDRIITQDETWLWHYDPETKADSSVWKTPGTPPPKKAKVSRSGGKHMFVFFMDRHGMILIHRVPEGQTINAAYYSKLLRRDLVHALRKKRPGLELSDMILHQDNAPPHTASSTQLEIDVLGFQRLSHPPYSPDLAPMDFRVFPEVKSQLRGSHFDSGEELMAETLKIVSTFDPEFYDDIFQKWISRHRKCVATEGDYI